MMHPETELRPTNVGLGVFATANIPRGTIVYVKDSFDVVVSPGAYQALDPHRRGQVDRYSYSEASRDKVLCWDLAKYVNHSCEANSMSTGWGFEIAVANIRSGNEITDEYGLLNLEEPLHCQCGSAKCRGMIGPRASEGLHESWDDLVQVALHALKSKTQPLWEVMEKEQRAEFVAYLDGKVGYRSVLEMCPFDPTL